MTQGAEKSVERVVDAMREHPGEPFSIDDMARVALFSKFHFSRIFQDATGLSPGRFLGALRLAEAKRLLLGTSLSVTDISIRVGYASVGTFSTRFKNCVGVAPSVFRSNGGFRPYESFQSRSRPGTGARVRGVVSLPDTAPDGPVFLGLFPEPVPQGTPVSCALLRSPGPFTIEAVPPGTWFLLAYCSGHSPAGSQAPGRPAPLVGACGPLTVRPGAVFDHLDLRLRSASPMDPPVLIAPLDLPSTDVETMSLTKGA